MPHRTFFSLCLLGFLTSCGSTGATESDTKFEANSGADQYVPTVEGEEIKKTGFLLSEFDTRLAAWSNLILGGTDSDARRKSDAIEEELGYRSRKHFGLLETELESGPVNNRIIAALALGFSGVEEALSPLLAALEDDDIRVERNALTGLRVLADPSTPLSVLCSRIHDSTDEVVRVQAAYALNYIVQAGGSGDCALDAGRRGILDQDPGVQTQCALLLGALIDTESLEALARLLYSDTPLVAHAGTRSLAYIAMEDIHVKGDVARALTSALTKVKNNPRERMLLRHLRTLSQRNFGEKPEDWIEWANELP